MYVANRIHNIYSNKFVWVFISNNICMYDVCLSYHAGHPHELSSRARDSAQALESSAADAADEAEKHRIKDAKTSGMISLSLSIYIYIYMYMCIYICIYKYTIYIYIYT